MTTHRASLPALFLFLGIAFGIGPALVPGAKAQEASVRKAQPESAGPGDRASEAIPAGRQQTARLDRPVRVKMDYLMFVPENYDKKEAWPLLLFLHGAGERGDDLERVKVHGPPRRVETEKDFPFLLVSPQCEPERWWQPTDLTALLDEIVARYKVDENRIYVTGLSMGGFGTWALAAYTPDRFAAIVPICGGSEPYYAKRFAHVPAWVFHGARDVLVPPARSRQMVDAMKKHGGTPKLTIYPEAGHDSWSETYDNPELYEWLLEQKKKPRGDSSPLKG